MKKSNIFKETFKDVKVRIASGIIAVVLVLLGAVYVVNPNMLKNIFGFSGIGLLGDYIVNDNVTALPVYYSIADLNLGDTKKAGRIMTDNELFGLDGYVNVQGVADPNGEYAKINFYNGEGGLARSWVGYITRVQLDTLTHSDSEVNPPPATEYIVTFNANGGSVVNSQTLAYGSKVAQPTSSKTGFVLEGWYDGTTKWNFLTNTVSSNLTLTAQWTAVQAGNPKPVITSVLGNPTGWVKDDITLTVNVSAGTPLSNEAYSFNNGATWQAKNSLKFSNNSTVNIVVRGADGQISAPTTVVINRIDKTAPSVPNFKTTKADGTVYSSGTWTNQNVTLSDFNATDTSSGIARYEYLLGCNSANSWAALNSAHYYTTDVDYTFCIRAVDNAGNASAPSSNLNLKVDKTAPAIALSDNSTGTSTNPTCAGSDNSVANPVNVTITDAGSGVNYSKRRWQDSGTWAAWGDALGASFTTTASAPGDRVLEVEAYDKAGNRAVRTSGHYYLEGPVVSIVDKSRTYPVSSGSLKLTYKCEAWHSLNKNCDSKFSTSTGSTMVYNNLSANIISNSGASITKHTTLSHSNSYQYFWVRANNSYCGTSTKGYRIARVFD